MPLVPLFEEFLSYLAVECNRSPLTITAYRSDFRLFTQCPGQAGQHLGPEDVDRQLIRRYVTWLHGQGHKPNSIARRLNSLRSFWKYLRDNGYTDRDPFLRVSVPKRERPLPVWLTADECDRLLEAAERQPSTFRGFRDRAIIAVLIFTGVRKAELLGLRLSSVDMAEATLRIECGKGGKSRLIPLAPRCVAALADWLELRPLCDHDRLFTSIANRPLGHKGLPSVLRGALRRARMAKRVTLHGLRHSFACLMLQGGCDLYSLSQLLGHGRLDTTARYLHTSARDLHRAIARHPLGWEAEGVAQASDRRDFAAQVGVQIPRRRAQLFVPHQLTHGVEVGAALNEESPERMAEAVQHIPAIGKARVA